MNKASQDLGNLVDKQGPCSDDIRQEYHPSASCKPGIFGFEAYRSISSGVMPPVEPEPWLPFKTGEDFEFSEIALATAMTKTQVNATIGLLHRCIDKGKGSFTLSIRIRSMVLTQPGTPVSFWGMLFTCYSISGNSGFSDVFHFWKTPELQCFRFPETPDSDVFRYFGIM